MAPKAPPPSAEWDALTPQEVEILRHCRAQLGADLLGLPDDLVTMMTRGYMGEKDPKAESVHHMKETAEWRKSVDIESTLLPDRLPAQRAEFERMWRSAIIGEDDVGHMVVIESIGKIPPKEFGNVFVGNPEREQLFLQHCTYNKEVLRKRNILRSTELKRRVYKMIVIIDLHGLGSSHMSSSFTNLLKTYIGKFSNLYPESLYKLYVINAPWVFSGVWTMISPFVHPVTRAKIHIISNPKYAMEDLAKIGVKLEFTFQEAYDKAPPLSTWAPKLAKLPPPYNPPGEERALK